MNDSRTGLSDEAAVIAAAREYFEGWYAADLARVDRVLHPALVKRSAMQVGSEPGTITTKERFLELVRGGGGVEDRTDDPVEVTVADIHHDIAAAVVRSAQYREYLHLLRTPVGWQIVNAYWQLTNPQEAAPG